MSIQRKNVSIVILVEGETELMFFKQVLENFLRSRLPNAMPGLKFISSGGRIPKGDKLKRMVNTHLRKHDAVIALTDVYTGTKDFKDANDAKHKSLSPRLIYTYCYSIILSLYFYGILQSILRSWNTQNVISIS
jgi:hypothetical protein